MLHTLNLQNALCQKQFNLKKKIIHQVQCMRAVPKEWEKPERQRQEKDIYMEGP